MKNFISFLWLNLMLLSCANSSLQPDTFERDAAQRVSNVLYGEIVSLKQVKIEGDTKSGTIVGGLVGAAAGSGVSDSKPESEIGAVLGGAIGATLGLKYQMPDYRVLHLEADDDLATSKLHKTPWPLSQTGNTAAQLKV